MRCLDATTDADGLLRALLFILVDVFVLALPPLHIVSVYLPEFDVAPAVEIAGNGLVLSERLSGCVGLQCDQNKENRAGHKKEILETVVVGKTHNNH